MDLLTRRIVFPEGDTQEIPHDLRINQLVDLNGYPLPLPLTDTRIIAYRVFRKSTAAERHEETVSYYLELVPVRELGGPA